jgi:hypothetical protein
MNTITTTRPTVQRPLRTALAVGPTAPAQARHLVAAAVRDWDVPVDPHVAALLTSELVTNAIRYEKGDTIKLFITCSCGHLRVYVHDTSRCAPVPLESPADAEEGRGLVILASLSTDWGHYRTPTGKAVYFTLAFESVADDDGHGSPANHRGFRGAVDY